MSLRPSPMCAALIVITSHFYSHHLTKKVREACSNLTARLCRFSAGVDDSDDSNVECSGSPSKKTPTPSWRQAVMHFVPYMITTLPSRVKEARYPVTSVQMRPTFILTFAAQKQKRGFAILPQGQRPYSIISSGSFMCNAAPKGARGAANRHCSHIISNELTLRSCASRRVSLSFLVGTAAAYIKYDGMIAN